MKILVAAIEMETDLEKYYLKQAKINKGNELEQIFTMLANDEKEHASILRSKLEEIDYSLEDSKSLQETKDLFKNMEDFNLDIKELPSQLDSLRFALDMEKKSIDAYKKMQTESDN
ncbi:MAG: ferritin family protein, partial [Epulopiscium sp.]|nr:ferritin family protein [Candidatus Epulonipiscium sp.]